ncbi:MAG: hypothetical protein ACXW11_05885 [Methylotenera sp.]
MISATDLPATFKKSINFLSTQMKATIIMNKSTILCITLASFLLFGCATTKDVMLAKGTPTHQVRSVAQAQQEDNSSDMNKNLQSALFNEGLTVKAPLPAGTRKSAEVDAVVSYSDVWRWDVVMYLQSVSIRLFDAQSGDLLVSGNWNDSALHGFHDSKEVVKNLMSEMLEKLRNATPKDTNLVVQDISASASK